MCGIVGALGAASIPPSLMEDMRDRLTHRGPDHGGLWLADDGQVCLGHRRLAIIDLSPEANQPFVSTDNRFVITFNGEIYNHRRLREELAQRGSCFRTRSDTEVLVEAFRHWGADCLTRLSGMFAFAIWDTTERRLFCARDRVGEKPFYYMALDDAFVFGSELKALLPWPTFSKEIDYAALIDYLSFGFVADPKTIWKCCRKLPPGHSMWIRTSHAGLPIVDEPIAYWDMEFDPDRTTVNWEAQILETLAASSHEMTLADVPVGAFLSGGVDSSSVVAALSKAGCTVSTFTVGFAEPEYDERRWARSVADLYGTVHSEQVLGPSDVAPVFEKMVWYYDEPFNDYSYLPTFCLCRKARERITVALSGDGGDELFAGYSKYQRLALRQQIDRILPRSVAPTVARAAHLFPHASPWRQRAVPYAMDIETMLLDMLNTGFSNTSLRAAARGPLAAALAHYSPRDIVTVLLRKAPPDEVGLINAMRYLDLKLTLAGDILVKVDRASMAVSLEVRPVYLHRDMLALAARIPPELLATRKQSKRLLKRALRAWLPDAILERKKKGFALPLTDWVAAGRDPLGADNNAEQVCELLDAAALGRTETSAKNSASGVHSLALLGRWLAHWT